jgi:hypothetical protein
MCNIKVLHCTVSYVQGREGYNNVSKYYEKVRMGGHIELSNDNPISDKFRNENDVIYEVDAFVNVVLSLQYPTFCLCARELKG